MKIISVLFIFLVSACSGFFPGNGNKGMNNINSTSLEMSDGSGALSSANHNDITPFLYRSGNRAWLFFASDRAGHYNIYFAEMDANGRFFNLTMMDSNVNSQYDTFSPVVFQGGVYIAASDNYAPSNFISYLVVSNGTTNLYSTMIDTNFAGLSPAVLDIPSIQATHISLYDKTDASVPTYPPYSYLSVSTGSSLTSNYQWSVYAASNTEYWVTYIPLLDASNAGNIYGIDGYTAPSPYYGQLFLMDIQSNSQRQLYFGALWVSNTSGTSHVILTNIYQISDYSSGYNDGYPCIDLTTMKVYFSSTRYGKGFWNLYRFNIKTFDREIQWNYGATNQANNPLG